MRDRLRAFEHFHDEYYEAVRRGMVVALQEPTLAADATQEAFTRAYMRWHRVRRAARPESFLYIAASRYALRRERPAEINRLPLTASDPGAHTSTRAIEDLPSRERLAIVLHHHAQLSAAELGHALHTSPESARFTLHEAYRRLGGEDVEDDYLPEVQPDGP